MLTYKLNLHRQHNLKMSKFLRVLKIVNTNILLKIGTNSNVQI